MYQLLPTTGLLLAKIIVPLPPIEVKNGLSVDSIDVSPRPGSSLGGSYHCQPGDAKLA